MPVCLAAHSSTEKVVPVMGWMINVVEMQKETGFLGAHSICPRLEGEVGSGLHSHEQVLSHPKEVLLSKRRLASKIKCNICSLMLQRALPKPALSRAY